MQALALQFEAMRVVDQAVEDRIGDGGIADLSLPTRYGQLAGQPGGASLRKGSGGEDQWFQTRKRRSPVFAAAESTKSHWIGCKPLNDLAEERLSGLRDHHLRKHWLARLLPFSRTPKSTRSLGLVREQRLVEPDCRLLQEGPAEFSPVQAKRLGKIRDQIERQAALPRFNLANCGSSFEPELLLSGLLLGEAQFQPAPLHIDVECQTLGHRICDRILLSMISDGDGVIGQGADSKLRSGTPAASMPPAAQEPQVTGTASCITSVDMQIYR